MTLIYHLLFAASSFSTIYVVLTGICPYDGKLFARIVPPIDLRGLIWVGAALCFLVAVCTYVLVGGNYYIPDVFYWTVIAIHIDAIITHHDRGGRFKRWLKSKVKFKRFDPRPHARPLPEPA